MIEHSIKGLGMDWTSSFSNNAVIIISSPRTEGEKNVARRLVDDLELLRIGLHNFHFEHHIVFSQQDLVELLRKIARLSKKGLRPIIHFDMHGDKFRGLEFNPSREFAPWPEVVTWLRKINTRAKNNLCVIAATCYGLNMIRPITIEKPVPFYCLIAPDQEISFGMIDGKMSAFYRRLFEEGSIDAAKLELSDLFKIFNCEKMLTISLGRYIKTQCKGIGLRRRKERLISGAVAIGSPNTPENLKAMQQLIKEKLAPSENLIRSHVSKFLIGKSYSITLDVLVELAE